jgi:ribosome-binding protein aMBF1 (putative translation factor)
MSLGWTSLIWTSLTLNLPSAAIARNAPPMEKSTYTPEYRVFLETLKDCRVAANLSQVKLAEMLRQSQSFVSKCERGETRVDIVQLRMFCRAFGITLPAFVAKYETRLTTRRR